MMTTMIESLLDSVAKTAVSTFKLNAEYFYEDRKTGNRHPVICIERKVEYHEDDINEGITIVRTGKAFLLDRDEWKTLDTWRSEMNIDVKKEPTPFGTDYIIRIDESSIERYEITYREPYSTFAQNRALYRINTIFISKDGRTDQTRRHRIADHDRG